MSTPRGTHALLVGVESAGFGKPLDGPMSDVLAYREWLVDRGVPPAQIHTCVSPLGSNAEALSRSGAQATSATSTDVRHALNTLHDARGDLLFVAWSGHGVINDEARRVLLADATATDIRSVALDALIATFASTWMPGFARQVVLVDTCSNYQDFAFNMPSEELPRGDPASPEQFVFFAAQPGQVARNMGAEKRGLFSRELLAQLKAEPADGPWPPDLDAVARRVQAAFAALRSAGKAAQTPVYSWSRDWAGNTVELEVAQTPVGTTQRWTPSLAQLDRLTKAILGCAQVQTPAGRDDWLQQVRLQVRTRVPRRADARSDVISMLRTSCDFAGGLEELLATLRFFDGDSQAWKQVDQTLRADLPTLRLDEEASP